MAAGTIKSDYDRDGMISAVDILSEDETTQTQRQLESFIDAYRSDPRFGDWTYFKSQLILKWLADLARHPVLLDYVEALIGPDILLWNGFIPVKPPASKGHFGWHQDATYWPLKPIDHVVTFWIAFSDVSLANGGMRMIPGSHKMGQLAHDMTRDSSSMLRRAQKVRGDIDEDQSVEVALKPGQASIHHPFTLHGSGGNPSRDWRLGIGLNYVAGDVAPIDGHQDSAMLLRGSSQASGFQLEAMPEGDITPQSLINYQAAVELAGTRYMNY